jgi:hypothetical protein
VKQNWALLGGFLTNCLKQLVLVKESRVECLLSMFDLVMESVLVVDVPLKEIPTRNDAAYMHLLHDNAR